MLLLPRPPCHPYAIRQGLRTPRRPDSVEKICGRAIRSEMVDIAFFAESILETRFPKKPRQGITLSPRGAAPWWRLFQQNRLNSEVRASDANIRIGSGVALRRPGSEDRSGRIAVLGVRSLKVFSRPVLAPSNRVTERPCVNAKPTFESPFPWSLEVCARKHGSVTTVAVPSGLPRAILAG